MKAEKDKAIRKTLALPDGYFKDLKLDKIDHPQFFTLIQTDGFISQLNIL